MPSMMAGFEDRNQAYKDNPEGLKNFLGAFPETMAATLVLIREVFGGAENYCKEYMGLEIADIDKIRQNVLQPLPPPFVFIDGVDNVRTVDVSARSPFVKVKPGIIYRGADTVGITQYGKGQLFERRIETIVDVRLEDGSDDGSDVAETLEVYEKHPLQAFIQAYAETLHTNGEGFKRFFTYLRDNPDKPVLVHCSAGKDRTGIAIALLLMVLGIQYDDIIADYALSGVGLQSAMPRLIEEFEARDVAYQNNPKGLTNFLSAPPEAMAATLVLIREKFGGAENYCKEYMQLGSKDMEKIRQNLCLKVPQPRPTKFSRSHNAM
ncbi:hypothetical protein SERLA73DRAFT_182333 [Serpula lacrymans var. lacrymans S7.3]|uniref:Tyrosine specific protein phosphatases domain-containing protein n=2 Tax=Serpula lacrymans var. lacrymans TaxID=341189 RepID=F8PXA2_SERL3|nr:uncharacterized protein SERLADRAFT_468928 [Serpula lacrymans var. lacrymans S7.9]EGN99377.1 hypothetical protein SERLA73DRAFT_182333 [Serpula lacrymans var. lacrymans S7.3]EGO24939.1 hypothetical protein SERLADRAFT_468928 [Serpula lacrymans var. lacrymans S7.9]